MTVRGGIVTEVDAVLSRYVATAIAHTRSIVCDHARRARRGRLIGGVAMLVVGGTLLPLGSYAYTKVEPGGFIDLSDLAYGITSSSCMRSCSVSEARSNTPANRLTPPVRMIV